MSADALDRVAVAHRARIAALEPVGEHGDRGAARQRRKARYGKK
jgi:hypothetical protein